MESYYKYGNSNRYIIVGEGIYPARDPGPEQRELFTEKLLALE
ncbi:hypothetical protein KKC1_16110 [Calderihabitans maritimus]|uniref:Uncharacterized protein n=1 Tax=Calderihabitans maritimus TaxID=1246530 RepID=A0A1Z5HSX8_9FIRM|nr:hypothetical protein KKC1_16110 [Calderihabitans maritimus]